MEHAMRYDWPANYFARLPSTSAFDFELPMKQLCPSNGTSIMQEPLSIAELEYASTSIGTSTLGDLETLLFNDEDYQHLDELRDEDVDLGSSSETSAQASHKPKVEGSDAHQRSAVCYTVSPRHNLDEYQPHADFEAIHGLFTSTTGISVECGNIAQRIGPSKEATPECSRAPPYASERPLKCRTSTQTEPPKPASAVSNAKETTRARNRAASMRFRRKSKDRWAALEMSLQEATEIRTRLEDEVDTLRTKNRVWHGLLLGDVQIPELQHFTCGPCL